MSEEKKKKVKRQRQEWRPNILFAAAYGVWRVVFAAAKIALGAVATVVIILGICMLAFAGSLADYLTGEIMPQAGMNLDDFTLDQTSFVYYTNSDGEIALLQQIHTSSDRQWADYEDIPQDLINATIAIEDKRFYEHQGVDWFTTIKAFANMFMGDDSKGGSTITQQLVKNLTQDDSVTVQRKLLELFRATNMERSYDKDTIMEWYLNYIYLGHNKYGVRSAAEYYFGKELEMLTTAECASLISITNNPSVYDPYGEEWMWRYNQNYELQAMTGADRNNFRKEVTLGEMVTQGLITEEQYEEAMAQEIVFKSGIDDGDRLTTCTNADCGYRNIASTFTQEDGTIACPVCGSAVSVKEDNSQDVYSWFVDTALEDVAKALCAQDGLEWTTGEGGTRTLYMDKIARGGYHIYTTLDMDVQNAIDAIYGDEDNIPKTRSGQQLSSAIVIIDNSTGYIVGMAGDVGEKTVHDAFNIATDKGQQVGSSIKPLTVYAPAFEAGLITPVTVIKDLPLTYDGGKAWPSNDNNRYSYSQTIFKGLEDSINAVAVNTLDLSGIGYAFEFGKNELGLNGLTEYYVSSSGVEHSDKDYAPLGVGSLTHGITIRDMATAYATFANDGVWRQGITFTKVYDSDGNLILDNEQQTREVFSNKTIQYVNYCLTNAVSAGTGYEARWSGWNGYVAGKTGTTNDNKDRLFCGYTNYYTAAVWCGYKTPEVIRMASGSGVNNPSAYLFRNVMQTVHEDLDPVRLYDRGDFVEQSICLDSGLLATDACKNDVRLTYGYTSTFTRVQTAPVLREDRVRESCDKHVMVDYCVEGDGVATEWCQHFANDAADADKITLEERSLTKVTREELDEILKAKNYKIWPEFLEDGWVYLVDERGRDDNSFKGLDSRNPINEGINASYKVCTLHTQQTWEAYQASQQPEPTEPGNIIDDILGGIFG